MKKKFSIAFCTLLLASALTVGAASAQSEDPTTDQRGGVGPGMGFVTACSTTNSTDIVAKALGINSTELRVALVSGQTVETLATTKNVTLQTISDALTAANKADLDQALKDGLLTQAQYDAIITRSANRTAPAAVGTPSASATAQADGKKDGGRGFHIRVAEFNVVFPETVAAKALNISCADLVKALQSGQSIAQVATSKNATAQTVIDALTAAYKDASAQDVKEGLITQAQATARDVRRVEQITNLVNNVRPQGPVGGPKDGGPRGNGQPNPGQPGNGRGPGQKGQPGAQPTMQATPAK